MGSNQVPAFKDVYDRVNPDFEIDSLKRDGSERGQPDLEWRSLKIHALDL